jgi:hypothetical protein
MSVPKFIWTDLELWVVLQGGGGGGGWGPDFFTAKVKTKKNHEI